MKMPTTQIVIPQWLALPITTRMKLVEVFKIPRTGGSHVQSGINGGQVITDGYTHDDLATMTLERLQVFASSTEPDFFKVFEEVINKLPEDAVASPEPVKDVGARMVIEIEGRKYHVVEELGDVKPLAQTLTQPSVVTANASAPFGLKRDGTPRKQKWTRRPEGTRKEVKGKKNG